ncbi:hypothetical protein TTHERM_00668040 (macronuclear) [Tetrahymena thermophila SB210]|uniref:Uncharacterized protein n=1 Tax=Tetrahymena thermophila (strain SB210) TaxID=312017 RepID=Q23T78_TETTS|nr:hypothetical protein TTHERM_00668040 [Tetrahymena thermophila SB210]EAR99828.2 hypothetical protein TTHERM_00668040 [Tetrahymena thermophila SB210]|eukprot:XP_001020073.2 hypothetical protein TTHERM_00668040 [Tetrahymena thermophila SB210]
MQSNSVVEKNIFQINAEKGNIFFLGHQKEQKQIEAPKFFATFETPQVKRSNSFLENMDTEYNKSSVKRELSPSLLSEGLEMEDLHYYIDQRFDTTPKIDSYVCGKKRRLKHLNNEDQQSYNSQINNLKDSEQKNEEVQLQKQLKFIY